MCGIAVSIGHVDPAVEAAVERMTGAQKHRGPDAGASWASPVFDRSRGAILAHRRLSIIDLSPDANQPMRDEESGNVVVFNGEIYGFEKLKDELTGLGVRFRTRSDTEVLLKAYGYWGIDAIARLRGMFALALWEPERRKLLVARDRVGIKPLYYARVVDKEGRATILLASELRAILASGLVERRLSEEALATYVWNGFVNGDQAAVAGVQMLPAGHLALIDLDAEPFRAKPYWQLPEFEGEGVDTLDELRGELETATRQHLVSDVPVGVFLSGGIDSSAVAALAARGAPGRISTFTIAFEDPAFDESAYARRVAEQLKTDHHEIVLGESAFRSQLDAALGCLDQPSFDAINTYFVSRAVREAGITVALAGTGGDELFGGYRSFREIPRGSDVARRAAFLPNAILRALARGVTRIAMGSGKIVPPQTRWGKLEDALTTRGDLVDLYQVSYGLFSGRFLGELVEPDLRARVDHGLSGGRRSSLRSAVRGIHGPRAVSTLELSNFLEQRLLRDTDCASMAVSLEVRVPLLDHRVIECVWRLSERRRFEPLGEKRALREAALGGLDPKLFDREKSGFVLPIDRWAREGLQVKVAETLNDRAACASVGLVPDAVARLWRGFQAGVPGLYWSRVWSLFVLLRWCAEHRIGLSGHAAGLRASA